MYPKLIEVKQESEEKYLLLLEKSYRFVVWVSFPIILFMSLGSDFIVDLLYGVKFTASSEILVVLTWCMFFASIGSVFVKVLYIEHYEKKYLYKSIFGVIVNIILNFILIRLYGVIGAAYATLITLFFVNYVYDLLDKDLRKFYYLKFKCFIPLELKGIK
jgi:O-antigen/teichoic acid export membrane protein